MAHDHYQHQRCRQGHGCLSFLDRKHLLHRYPPVYERLCGSFDIAYLLHLTVQIHNTRNGFQQHRCSPVYLTVGLNSQRTVTCTWKAVESQAFVDVIAPFGNLGVCSLLTRLIFLPPNKRLIHIITHPSSLLYILFSRFSNDTQRYPSNLPLHLLEIAIPNQFSFYSLTLHYSRWVTKTGAQ